MKLASISEYALIQGIQSMLASMMGPVDPTGLFTTIGVPTVALRPSTDVDCELLGVEYTFQIEIIWNLSAFHHLEIQLIFGKFGSTMQELQLTLLSHNKGSLVTHYDERHAYNYVDDTEVNGMAAALAFVFYRFLVEHEGFVPALVPAVLGQTVANTPRV
jgi:hypothetical protein